MGAHDRGGHLLSLSSHLATTRHAPSLYPFQAEAALPAVGPVMGIDVLSGGPFCFDPFALYPHVLTNPNVLVLGSIGSGKSATVKWLLWLQVLLCGRQVAILDPKGEYRALAEALGLARVRLEPGGRVRLNPLDAGPGAERDREALRRRRAEMLVALATSNLDRAIRSEEHAAVRAAVDDLGDRPVLAHVVDLLLSPSAAMAKSLRTTPAKLGLAVREVALELRRLIAGDLAGMFDGQSSFSIDWRGPGVVIDLSPIYESPAVLGPTMVAAGAWLAELLASAGPQRYLVLDEVWRVLADRGVATWVRSTMKLARSLGAAVVLVTHTLDDFGTIGYAGSEAARVSEGLVADTATRVVMAQPDAAVELTRSQLGLTTREAELLPGLAKGRALWHVGASDVALVRHMMPPEVLELTDTDQRMTGLR
jgi:type IV secretory pathway VirB4 component